MFDRLGGSSRRVARSLSLPSSSSSSSSSSSAFSDSSLCSLELGPDRRGELRARRTVSAPSSGSPRGHSEEIPVQVERLGAQQKCLRSRGRGPGRGGRGGIGGEGELSTEFTSLARRSPSLSLSTLPVLTPHELQDIKEKLPVPALDLIIRLSLFKRASRETPSKVSTTSTL